MLRKSTHCELVRFIDHLQMQLLIFQIRSQQVSANEVFDSLVEVAAGRMAGGRSVYLYDVAVGNRRACLLRQRGRSSFPLATRVDLSGHRSWRKAR